MDILLLRSELITREILDILCQLSDTKKVTINNAKLIIARQLEAGHFTYVGYLDGIPIAIGSIIISERFIHNNGRVALLEDIAIHKDYHSMGYGKQLLKHLIKIAKKNKCYKVILDCSDENMGFYIKCGMQRWHNQMRIDL